MTNTDQPTPTPNPVKEIIRLVTDWRWQPNDDNLNALTNALRRLVARVPTEEEVSAIDGVLSLDVGFGPHSRTVADVHAAYAPDEIDLIRSLISRCQP